MWLSLFSLLADVQPVDKGRGTLLLMMGSGDYTADLSGREETAAPSAKILLEFCKVSILCTKDKQTSCYLWGRGSTE